ncbi:DNA replication and repair protein RecO [Melghiribacillus thermohalophilus]|uniref:DNA repair protein RecO n=1 Tax=Melghiribacillus thermohalophilus TaxID=1324956 RepID=A0A4R3NDK9_9BACI|nr:DNA repair protein RecO [Melghiribacillus thermohalophilus]TCT27010.1 DNA replication and repair protein RecO [Melghiribacillus thermohalophilus]
MFEKLNGIVLKTRDYGETHKIITLFTKERGKIGAIARGAKKPRSRMAAVTQPFVYGTYLVQVSKNLGNLQQGEIIDSFRYIREDIVKTAYAAYLSELTDRLLESHSPDVMLWEQLLHTLERMSDEPDVLTMMYELKVFERGGFAPELSRCVSCGSSRGIQSFSVIEGGFLCSKCNFHDPDAIDLDQKLIQILRYLRYLNVERVGQISIKPENRKMLRRILDDYYDRYGGYHLKSRRFIQQLDRFEW